MSPTASALVTSSSACDAPFLPERSNPGATTAAQYGNAKARHAIRNSGSRPLPSLLDQLLDAENPDDVRHRIAGIVGRMGFDWLGYGRVNANGAIASPVSMVSVHGDSICRYRYLSERFTRVDPLLGVALRSSLPHVWHLEELALMFKQHVQSRHFIDALRRTGMRCGVILALPIARPNERVVVSLMSRANEIADTGDDTLSARVLTLGVCLHEYYTHHTRLTDNPTPPAALSPTQRAILSCLANGSSDKQIADRLDLSLHAVDYHMRQLRKLFGARNRLQLAPQALRQVACF